MKFKMKKEIQDKKYIYLILISKRRTENIKEQSNFTLERIPMNG